MFLLKKIVAPFFYPFPLCLGILILGLLCLWATRRQRLGKGLVTLGTVLLLLLSLPFIAGQAAAPLESRYPALLHPEAISRAGEGSTSPQWIVVLGGGHALDPRHPANSQTSAATLERVVEGVRLYKALPGSKLLLSGGGVFDPEPEAAVMARVAGVLGVKPQDIRLETESRDTADQAKIVADLLGRERFILVTSATHMPRAMALFRKRGVEPIPAPTDFRVQDPQGAQGPNPGRYFPSASGLEQVETAAHEYLGLAWAWLRGAI
jgi:uncharacterized SAM-binding protein YcdF (DUF218 family)